MTSEEVRRPGASRVGVAVMSETFELEAHVRACVEGDDLIFLDLRRDRYLRVSKGAAPAIAHVVQAGSAQALPTLIAQRLIKPVGRVVTTGGIAHALGRKPHSALELPEHAATPPEVWLGFTWACLMASFLLKSRRLDLLFSGWRSSKARPSNTLAYDASSFDALRPWWPARRVCLFDSIALSLFLRARGHTPDLVIGVRTRPFAAHCWVEANGMVVGDTLEQCVAFTPIARA